MNRSRLQSQRGTVLLVTLCFMTVLGLILASYLAVCSNAMNLSSRSFQTNLSRQLAEAGVDEAIRAFNAYDWSNWSSNPTNVTSGAWTLDTTNHRATRTITFARGKLGQGVTGTIKLRIDNYDAAQMDATWQSTRTYNVGEAVGMNGIWYRSLQSNNLNNNPSSQTTYTYWAPDPIPWSWTSYKTYTNNYDIVCYGGSWWLCSGTHTSTSTFDWSKWTWIPAPSTAWAASTYYGLGQFVYRTSNSTWYRCTTAHNSTSTWDSSKWTVAAWSYNSSHTYTYNDVANYNGTWYRFIYSTNSSGLTPTSYPTVWESMFSGTWGWNSGGVSYAQETVVYYSSTGQWYRCIQAHTSSSTLTPTNTSYWSSAPLLAPEWNSTRQYAVGDVARFNGIWYRCLVSNNNNQPSAYTSNWASALNSSYAWSASSNYSANSYAAYGGVWYRCLVANSNQTPNNTTYWTAVGAPVVYAEGSVTFGDGSNLRTQLYAPLAAASLFPNAIAATTAVTLSSSSSAGVVDSYNSALSAYTAGGATYSAVVASNTAVTANGGVIKGYVSAPSSATSPYAPVWTYGTSAVLTGSGSSGMDLTRVSRSPYIPAFSITDVPAGTDLNVTTGTLGVPGSVAPSVYTYNGNLNLNLSTEILTVVGPTILRVNGNLRIYQNTAACIRIASGGSLTIYVTGNFRAQDTGGGIDNETLDPSKLTVLCSRSGTATFEYSSSQPFYGTLYAPNMSSVVTIDNNAEIFGAMSVQSISFADPAKFHYDTALRYGTTVGIDQPYTITEMRQLADTELIAMP